MRRRWMGLMVCSVLVGCGVKVEGHRLGGQCPKGKFKIAFVGSDVAKVTGTVDYSLEYTVDKDLVKFKAGDDVVTARVKDGQMTTDPSRVNIGGCTFTKQK